VPGGTGEHGRAVNPLLRVITAPVPHVSPAELQAQGRTAIEPYAYAEIKGFSDQPSTKGEWLGPRRADFLDTPLLPE